ncbi:MAG: hypothetical protein R3257_02100, partial [bacterium]|nr:hypothetical protein [bacterium]
MVKKFFDKEIDFMKYRWLIFGLSMALIGVCVFLLATRGLDYGTDFKGGLKLIYQFTAPTTEGEITEATIDALAAAWGSNATLDPEEKTDSANYSY